MALLILVAGSVQAQSKLESLFKKLGENDKMTVVYISKDMMSMIAAKGDSTAGKGIKDLSNELGFMRVISSQNLTPEEQANYNNMINSVLSDGYTDYMNVSTKEGGKQTDVRMCVKPIDKDSISEFVIYVREGKELTLIGISGKIKNTDMMNLTKLGNLKGMLNQSMKSEK
ncbi:MAG: DUF4252 domain-containing protein [Bacteroidota bacterium]|nr:DUF4252 domain-containing protein [Bacteroidota bacterium]